MRRRCPAILIGGALLLAGAAPARAAVPAAEPAPGSDVASTPVTTAAGARVDADRREWLVPALKGAGLRVSPGPRQFLRAFAFSPAIGRLGDQDLFALRLAYNPNTWLAWEVALGHNPTSSLQALLHTFNAVVRRPVPWRLQPYLTAGYGMMTVYPGRALEADPVTKNAVTYGGGLELYLRDDVALRSEMRAATVFGQEAGHDGTVTYTYREYTAGIVFYRKLGN